MSIKQLCPSCFIGNHAGHDPHHGLRPGLIGGSYCPCEGECAIGSLPCCNVIEQDNGTATICSGTMIYGWPAYRCVLCHAYCGTRVHPEHARDHG